MDSEYRNRKWNELMQLSKSELAYLLVKVGVHNSDGSWSHNAGPISQVMKWKKSEIALDLVDMGWPGLSRVYIGTAPHD